MDKFDELPTFIECAGCGYRAPGRELHLRCPRARAGDDIDHLMTRRIDPARASWPSGGEANPYIRYRALFHWYNVARACGRSDAAIVDDVARLDEAVERVDGRGFRVTPLDYSHELDAWIKDETNNVSGSHKARHLFGTLLSLRFMGTDDPDAPLAIASCGNAARAAAVIARAAGRELRVFVPQEAERGVIGELRELGAVVSICARDPDEAGDPSVARLREAIAAGAIPFTCQGNENGTAIEGGLTLGYEIADALMSQPRQAANGHLDDVFVQVGGGALASSAIQALDEAHSLGVLENVPRLNTVQTQGVAPLERAYRLVHERLDHGRALTDVLREAACHRSEYMRPWSAMRPSIAGGILDDETYDWLAVVRGMLETGGQPFLVDERALRDANDAALDLTTIKVDATGSAGLAGLLAMRQSRDLPSTHTSAVLFTGALRS